MRKTLAILSAAAMTCGLFAGCQPGGNAGAEGDAKGLTSPYFGDDLIIASLSQLQKEGLIQEGESPIADADAILGNDIFISNGKIAATIAVDTPDPWGYPVGSMVDLATVEGDVSDKLLSAYQDGALTVSRDRLWDMRLLMNSWDTWAPSTCGDMTFEVVEEYQFDEQSGPAAALKVTSYYSEKSPADTQDFETPLAISMYYSLAAEDDYFKIKTVFENSGEQTYHDRATGFSLSSKSTSVFSPGVEFYHEDPVKAINDFTSIYNADYTVGLLTPGVDDVYTGTGYSDTYQMMSYEPESTQEIVAYLRLDNVTDISDSTTQLMDIKGVAPEDRLEIRGVVVDDTGVAVPHASVAVERNFDGTWKPMTWCTANEAGEYSLLIPKPDNLSDYRVYGMAENYAITPSAARPTINGDVTEGEVSVCETEPLVLSRAVQLDVNVKDQNGNPVNAKIKLAGVNRCVVDYIANDTFFTDLDQIGHAEVLVYPGDYELLISSGDNFFSKTVSVKGNTSQDTKLDVTIDRMADLREDGWYNMDLHHHVSKADACTTPLNFVKSNMAEGLTILYSSDHDDTSANHEVAAVVEENNCDAAHIPGVEISASWSHFNVVPQDEEGREYMQDTASGKYKFNQYAQFRDIVDSVHERNMLFIANHPWIGYGLFNAQNLDSVPGGYYDQFDLIEINGAISDKANAMAMESARTLWTESLDGGEVYFLTGGSDTHDVLDSTSSTWSGEVRSFIKLNDTENLKDELAAQLEAGHSYVSFGPLMFPADDAMFGETYTADNGQFSYTLPVQAVNGLEKIEVYSQDGIVDTFLFDGAPETGSYTFETSLTEKSWYQFVVTDAEGLQAYSNPIFVEA